MVSWAFTRPVLSSFVIAIEDGAVGMEKDSCFVMCEDKRFSSR